MKGCPVILENCLNKEVTESLSKMTPRQYLRRYLQQENANVNAKPQTQTWTHVDIPQEDKGEVLRDLIHERKFRTFIQLKNIKRNERKDMNFSNLTVNFSLLWF